MDDAYQKNIEGLNSSETEEVLDSAIWFIENADKVITMGCGVEQACPASFVGTEDWGLDDPKDRPVNEVKEIRDEIKRRVTELVRGLDI